MQTSVPVCNSLTNPGALPFKSNPMADEKKDTPKTPEASPEPSPTDAKKIAEEYMAAKPKDRLTKFYVDPVTKTLRKK